MESVFIYWDNSNIFHEAQRLAAEQEEGPGARYRVRIHFENMLRLAHADRLLRKARAAGSVPPEMRQLWNRMEGMRSGSSLVRPRYARPRRTGYAGSGIAASNAGRRPGFQRRSRIAVLLTGDGAGYREGGGFHSTLERMHRRGWRVEILSWAHSTNQRMRRWAEANGIFVSLERFLRIDHLHGAIEARVRACARARSRRVESVPPAHVTPPIQANTEDCSSDGQSLPATATARGGRCTHS